MTRRQSTGGPGLVRSLTMLAALVAACIGNHPKTCSRSGECQPGGICDGQGFCARECACDADCPCGSTCSPICGLCLRRDTGGLATCFAVDRNVRVNEALGACRGSFGSPGAPEAGAPAPVAAAESDGGACLPAPEKLSCTIDAGGLLVPDAATSGTPPSDGSVTDAEGSSKEAGQ